MSLTPFIKWYRDGGCILRGHGLGEDIRYTCGDKPARYPVPTTIGDTDIESSVVLIWSADDLIEVLGSWYA